jgi:hypothetical protein
MFLHYITQRILLAAAAALVCWSAHRIVETARYLTVRPYVSAARSSSMLNGIPLNYLFASERYGNFYQS